MLRKVAFLCVLTLAVSISGVCIRGLADASAQDRCVVADPSGTPLNIRSGPNDRIIGTISNGIFVTIFDQLSVSGRTWVYVGRYEDRVPIGWVYRDYLNCAAAAASQPSSYVLDGLALGGKVHVESAVYKEYRCAASDKFSKLHLVSQREDGKIKSRRNPTVDFNFAQPGWHRGVCQSLHRTRIFWPPRHPTRNRPAIGKDW